LYCCQTVYRNQLLDSVKKQYIVSIHIAQTKQCCTKTGFCDSLVKELYTMDY